MDSTTRGELGQDSKTGTQLPSNERVPELDTTVDKHDKLESVNSSPTDEIKRDDVVEKPEAVAPPAAPPGQKPPPPEALERSVFKTAVIMFALCVWAR
jgi:hypothetical protein